jgi:uncharacterized protein YkwD
MATRSTRPAAKLRTVRLVLEQLETRYVLSGVQPAAQEQLFLEQLNDIRANPAAYGAAINLPAINSVAPAAPLAWDARLIQTAEQHTQDMNANNYFSHYDLAGHDPGWRETQAGYPWTHFGESIAAGYPTDAAALQALIVDTGVPDVGHRLHLLGINNSDESVGIGVVQNGTGTYSDYYTIDTGNTSDSRPFITGAVFNDQAGTGKYAISEGLAGVTVTVAGVGSVQAFDTGGYGIQVNPGTYVVTASGGGLANPITQTVTVGSSSVRLNFIPGYRQSNAMPGNLLAVAGTVAKSPESYSHFINTAYQAYLGRGPDGAGLQYWLNRMQQGMTDEQVEASFIGSQEYIAHHGGTSAWISGMYQDLLGRSAAQSEIDTWLNQMAHGESATQVALGFATSPEREGERVGNTYEVVLGRKAGASEISYWVNVFEHGGTTEDVAAGFLSSPEFYNNMGKANLVNWLQAVYQDALHRPATTGEIGYWETQLH